MTTDPVPAGTSPTLTMTDARETKSPPTAAYIHVPFCLHRCGYCDFTVIAGRDDLIPAYLQCLEMELQRELRHPHPIDTLFLGGGTPSHLPAEDLQRLFALLKYWLPLRPGGEFSMECNPDGMSADRIDVITDAGINRVSLGVQSFTAAHLQTLERSHAPETVAEVVNSFRQRGLRNVSLDLIFGVPGQTLSEWEQSLRAAMELQPQHISTYGLTFEKGTAFWTRRLKQLLRPVPEELEREMYALAMTALPARGYQQYELSNFAQPGAECRHNQVYWRHRDYFGFGPGAAALRNRVRQQNHRSVSGWIKRVRAGQSAVQESEQLTPELWMRESVMLGLRQISGITRAEFRTTFGREVRDLEPAAYDEFLAHGLLQETPTQVRLTREGRFVADSVMSEFL